MADPQDSPSLIDQAVDYVKGKWDEGGEKIHNTLEAAHQGDYAPLQDMAVQNAMMTVGSAEVPSDLQGYASGAPDAIARVASKLGLTGAAPEAVVKAANAAFEAGKLSGPELMQVTNASRAVQPVSGALKSIQPKFADGGPVAEASVADTGGQLAESAPAEHPGVPIYDISGPQPILGDMHPDDVHEAVSSGRYSLPKGSTVPVFSPDGSLGDIPAEDAPSAFQGGYKYATPDAIEEHHYGSGKQQALAGVEGLASGLVSKPIAHGLEMASGLTTGKDIEAREKANPWTSGIGEAAGLVGGSLYGVGEGAALEKAGAAAAKFLGPKGAGTLAKIGARSLSDATQMVLYQSGNEVSKLIEGDPTQSAGSAITDIGLSGLLGAGIGGAFGAASPLWSATVGTKAGQFVEDFKGRLKFLKDNPDLNESLAKELTEHHTGVKSAADEVYGASGIKAQGIADAMPEMSPKIQSHAEALSGDLQKQIEKMKADPYSYPPRLTSKMEGEYNAYLQKVKHPEASSADIFNAGQDLKQQLQGYSKFEKMVNPVDEGYDFIKDAKGLAHKVRTSLEDSETWGRAGDLQQKINKAFSEYLPALKDFESKFGTKVGGEVQIDPGKVQTYLGQLGKPNATVKQQMLDNFLKASEKYKAIIDDVHKGLGSESPIKPSSLHVAHSTLDKQTAGGKIADLFIKKGIENLAGSAVGTSLGAGAGHLVGAGQIGAIIGEKALGPFFSDIFHSIAKPIIEGANSSKGFKAGIDYAIAVAKGEAAINRAAKSVFKSSGEIGVGKLEADMNARKRLDNQLQAIQSNPEKLIKVASSDVGHYLPTNAAAISSTATAAASYLNNLRPKPQSALPLDSHMPPEPVAQAAYHRALDIANQPLLVAKSIVHGTLTPQDVQTLHAVNPGAYKSMATKLTTHMMDQVSKGEMIPYRTRQSLSMFLGKPLDSTMTPEGIMGAQPKPQQPTPDTSQAPASRPKTSTAKLGTVAKQSRTQGQAREARGDKV